jgi:hypothetical protein
MKLLRTWLERHLYGREYPNGDHELGVRASEGTEVAQAALALPFVSVVKDSKQ